MTNYDIGRNFISVGKPSITVKPQQNNIQQNFNNQTLDFKKLLEQKLSQKELVISKHAKQRIDDRNIDMSSQMLNKINEACDKAEAKGVKDALILGDNAMFIVNIPSKTIVTALSASEMKNNVFTNIDGTVIL